VSTSLDVAPWQLEAAADDVEDSCSAACWTVEERGWKQVLPDLPDEVIALLATPVVVTAEALGARGAGHGTDPVTGRGATSDAAGDAARAPGPVAAQWVEPPANRTARFLAPAPPRRTRGRHRRPATVAR
jgi:hypothetical protein